MTLIVQVEHGATPIITAKEAQEMGFRIMIFSFASLAPAYIAIKRTLEKVKREGITGTPTDLTPKRLFDVLGMQESVELDNLAGGNSFQAKARL